MFGLTEIMIIGKNNFIKHTKNQCLLLFCNKNDAEAEPLSLKSTEEKTEIKEIKHIPKTKMVDGAVIKNITDTKTFALSVRIKLKAV